MCIALGDPKKNRERAASLIEEACRRGSKFVVLPELWTTGYSLKNIRELAEPLDEATGTMLLDICSKWKTYVIGSIAESREGKIFNTATIIGPKGLLGSYSKVHLFRLLGEHECFTHGNSCSVFQTDFGKVGLALCYDIRFPELTRKLALNKAQILFVPAEWPYLRGAHWELLLKARAIENQIFVVGANRVGSDENNTFFGHSMILDPMGKVLIEGGDTELILTCELDMNLIDKTRSLITCFKDRRPALY
jgi:predicted amidohydrolase